MGFDSSRPFYQRRRIDEILAPLSVSVRDGLGGVASRMSDPNCGNGPAAGGQDYSAHLRGAARIHEKCIMLAVAGNNCAVTAVRVDHQCAGADKGFLLRAQPPGGSSPHDRDQPQQPIAPSPIPLRRPRLIDGSHQCLLAIVPPSGLHLPQAADRNYASRTSLRLVRRPGAAARLKR